MAFGGFDHNNQQPMSEINVTPLVDVMLVLLIIFMVTAPLMTHAIKVELPQASNRPNVEKPDTISLSLDGQGRVFWNKDQVSDAQLPARLAEAAARDPQPELRLRADKDTRYQKIAQVMSQAQAAGLTRIGFVTDPRQRP